ncbi:MAG: DUF4349 domain-containing protein [Actinomycetota bacterium]|nr:DUF4349 domain-containing protein [Actinomycetota bacterium]
MTSPDLINELTASRPVAPAALRVRVREIAAEKPAHVAWPALRLPLRRITLVAAPTMAALALGSAVTIGLTTSSTDFARENGFPGAADYMETTETLSALDSQDQSQATEPQAAADPVVGATPGRIQDVNATLTLEVADSDGVSKAAQDALALTRRVGGHVVTASVTTGVDASASLVVQVPVAKVQEAIVGLSALGTIVAQNVTIADLQEDVEAFERRQRSLRSQIALVVARLGSDSLNAEERARLEARLKNLRDEFRGARISEANVRAQGRMAAIQLAVGTPESRGGAVPTSRFDRTFEKALDVLAWEGVIALAVAIVVAPFALLILAAWLGRRFYRRREEERLLAT